MTIQHFSISGYKLGQRGAALVTALIFLLIMTILSITSLGTTTLEEKMAANSQSINRSFQAAEAGIEQLLSNRDAYQNTVGAYELSNYQFGNYNLRIDYRANYRQQTSIARGTQPSDSNNAYHHFEFTSTATSSNGGTPVTLRAGGYREGPKL